MMNQRTLWTLVLAILVAPLAAQGPLAEVRVSIEAVNQPLRAVLAELARQTGVEIAVDPRVVDGPVVLQLTDQPLDRALDLLTRGAGLVWTPRGNGAYVTIDPNARVSVASLGELPAGGLVVPAAMLARPVTLGLDKVALADAVAAIARASGVRLALDGSVPGSTPVTASFNAAPLSRCLYLLGLAAGLYVRADGQALRLHSPDRVTVEHEGGPPSVVELPPANYRGVLGFLVTDELWREPARWGLRVQQDPRAQPMLSFGGP